MYTTRLTQLLLLALSASTAVQAMMVNPEAVDIEVVDILAEDGRLLRRQSSQSSSQTLITSSSSSVDPKTTSTTTSKPTTSAPTTSKPDATPTSSSTSQPGDKTSDPVKPTSESSSSSTSTPEPSTITTVVTTHAPDGSPTTYTSKAVTTPPASLSGASGAGTTSEMTQDTKNIIIGTVVGIGGAIVLGVAGYLGWRIWGKKKAAEENDGLMSYGGDYPPEAKAEATTPPNARTPFQSTLESYHAPTQVNTASNF
jgi:cobalamin biosynthesis Mg chelatase CobN